MSLTSWVALASQGPDAHHGPGRIVLGRFFHDMMIGLGFVQGVFDDRFGLGKDQVFGGQAGIDQVQIRHLAFGKGLELVLVLVFYRPEQLVLIGRSRRSPVVQLCLSIVSNVMLFAFYIWLQAEKILPVQIHNLFTAYLEEHQSFSNSHWWLS